MDYFTQTSSNSSAVRRAVLRILDDREPFVFRSVLRFFANMSAFDETVRHAVLQRLKSGNSSIRESVVRFFTDTDAANETVRQAILQRLSDDEPLVRSCAVRFFAQTGAESKSASKAVLRRLDDENALVRGSAVEFFVDAVVQDATVVSNLPHRYPETGLAAKSTAFTDDPLLTQLVALLRAFRSVPIRAQATVGRKLTEVLGQLAATEPNTLSVLLEEGLNLPYFRLDLALRTYLEQKDRNAREASPLTVDLRSASTRQ